MDIQLKQAYSFIQKGKRGNQEDARFPDADMPGRNSRFFVVCDGVGGNKCGEVASRMVCDVIGDYLSGRDWEQEFTQDDFRRVLESVYRKMEQVTNRTNRGMATTLVFAAFHSGGCLLAHIGDSRIYQIRPGLGILYRSEDHSLVNSLAHSGCITPNQAESYPDSNVIIRSMSVVEEDKEKPCATIIQIQDVCPGDYFFLCTDGVLSKLPDERLEQILNEIITDREKCMEIASLCKDSDDNNTAILVPVGEVKCQVSDDHTEVEDGRNTATRMVCHPIRGSQEETVRTTTSLKSNIIRFISDLF